MMSKLKFIAAIVLVVFSISGFCDVPNQVVLHYTGNVVNRPCDISVEATTILNMGDVDANTMQSTGSKSPWLNSQVSFTSCDIETNIVITTVVHKGELILSPPYFPVYRIVDDSFVDQLSLEVDTTLNGHDVNMYYFIAGLSPLIITPIQRTESKYTSFSLPLKFRFIKTRIMQAEPFALNEVYGVYFMSVEYK